MQHNFKHLFTRTTPLLLSCLLTTSVSSGDWMQFRGPSGNGAATAEHYPTTWSSSENLAWQADLPGRGISSPIVVAGRVLVTACSGIRQDRLHVLCFDQCSGKQLWERQFWATGRTQTHQKINTAAPTPVSDGQAVYALFSTNDLFALDLEGNLLWLRGLSEEYPNANNSLGMASSPAVADDAIFIRSDQHLFKIALPNE